MQTQKRSSLPLTKMQRMQELKEQLQYQRLINQNLRNKNMNLTDQGWRSKKPLSKLQLNANLGQATQEEMICLQMNVQKVNQHMMNRTLQAQA